MRIYIAGNIDYSTQNQEQAMAKFQAAEDRLREQGYEVVNPFKTGLDFPASREKFFLHEVALLLDCDEIYLLCGWERSSIARVFKCVANAYGLKITYEANLRFPHIKQAIFDAMGVTYVDMTGDCRDQKMVFARMIFAHLCRKEGVGVKRIAEELGRDHSTVIYYLKNYANDISCTPAFKRYAEEVEQSLKTLTK